MVIKIYKTFDISNELWNKIVIGFNASFNGYNTNKEKLIIGATSNSFGYSYHSIYFDGDIVAGFNTIIPNYYIYNGIDKIILGLSGTTFVLKEYRKDIFIFYDMYMALKEHCKKENIIAFLGVPNKNSYQYAIKFLKYKEVFNLSYYILPVKYFQYI